MSEREDELTITFEDGEKFLMTRENTSLFTFMGNLATRNHVFMALGYDEERDEGSCMYVFSFNPNYAPLAKFLAQHNFPAHLNLTEVSDTDERAFQQALSTIGQTGTFDKELSNGVPEDWL